MARRLLSENTYNRLICDLQRLAHTNLLNIFHPNSDGMFLARKEYYWCDLIHKAIGSRHFLHSNFIPEVVRAGLDLFPILMPIQQ